MTGALLIVRVELRELYSLRNVLFRLLSVLANGYGGTVIGISNDAERVPPCESRPLLNFGMAIIYFGLEEDAKRFIYSDQGFLDGHFVETANVFIVPVIQPPLVGSHGTSLLFTEIQRPENYQQLPNPEVFSSITQCGAVPLLVDTTKIYPVRSYDSHITGLRVCQFPNKRIYYDWAGSDSGRRFREEICKIRSLNNYIATFAKDIF